MSEKSMTPDTAKKKSSPSSALDVRAHQRHHSDGVEDSFRRKIPDEPYLLATPSDKPYKLAPEQKDMWRLPDLFGSREEYLQYQTFFWRDSASSLFELRAPHELEARSDSMLKVPGAIQNGSSTPLQIQVVKKKITLSDYKNKTKVAGQEGAATAESRDKEAQATGQVNEPAKAIPAPTLAPPFEPVITGNVDKRASSLPKDHSALKSTHVPDFYAPSPGDDEHLATQGPLQGSKVSDKVSKAQSTPPSASAKNLKRPHEDETVQDAVIASAAGSSHRPSKLPRILEHTSDSREVLSPKTNKIPALAVTEVDHTALKKPSQEAASGEKKLETPEWLTESQGDNVSAMLAQQPKDHGLSLNDTFLDWIPGSPSRLDGAHTPPLLPELPSWPGKPSSRMVNGASHSPNKSSSPDTLRLSATYSQTSHSSLASSNVDPSVPPAPATTSTKALASVDTKSRGRANSAMSERADAKLSKASSSTKGQAANKEVQNAGTSATKVALKTIKVNPGSSSFFENLKTNIPSSSPYLDPSKPAVAHAKLIVRLKYGKNRAKNIQRILQMRPTPKREPPASSIHAPPSTTGDRGSDVQPNGDLPVKNYGKRQHPGDDQVSNEPAAKRRKEEVHENSPRTPNMPPVRSPTTVTPLSALHRQVVTPRTDPKSTKAMVQASTPHSNLATPTASAGVDLVGNSAKSSERGSSGPWKAEFDRYLNVARELKREMQKILKTKWNDDQEESLRKRAASDGVESVVCFMRGFLALGQYDRSSKSLIRAWESLLPLAREVCGACQNYKPLNGISVFLNTACCSMLASLHARVKADEYTLFGDEPEFLKKVHGNLSKLYQLGSDSERLLRQSSLAAEYPLAHAEYQNLAPGVFIKPMAATRVACKVLEEWAKKENMSRTSVEEGLCATL